MQCDYFGKCGSCTLWEMDYETQLAYKTEAIKKEFGIDHIDIIRSAPAHFRNRAEFRIYHDYDNNTLTYAMHGFEKKRLVPITSCSIVSESIAAQMQPLLDAITPNEILRHRLYSVEFLSSSTGELLVTLIYHKKIDEAWLREARKLAQDLGIDLIGRSRGVRLVVTREYIDETLQIDGKPYRFRLYDTGFIQPNSGVNARMVGWVRSNLTKEGRDLLELYCGHGNFTIPLSEKFNRVVATEISKRSIRSAGENCALNGVDNIDFVRLSAEELTEALEGKRSFRRLEGIDLTQLRFSHLFVDPPRAGLDEKTRAFARQFENMIYISCNPETLKRDLDQLHDVFIIEKFAVFDQFAYTKHLECGVFLKKRG
jgi:tRNA (uracil-5-)-methyltransferase